MIWCPCNGSTVTEESAIFRRLRIWVDPFRLTAGLRGVPDGECILSLALRHCSTRKHLDRGVINGSDDCGYGAAEDEARS